MTQYREVEALVWKQEFVSTKEMNFDLRKILLQNALDGTWRDFESRMLGAKLQLRKPLEDGPLSTADFKDFIMVECRTQAQDVRTLVQGAQPAPLGQTIFPVGAELVSVFMDDCMDPILFDFGPGADAYFVYTRGRTVPKSGRRG